MLRFSDVIGNLNSKHFLQNLLLTDGKKFIILQGPSGHGKSTLAKASAAYVLCTSRDEKEKEPCCECKSCKAIAQGLNSEHFLTVNIGMYRDMAFLKEFNEEVSRITDGTNVIILEEFHSLDKLVQEAILDVIDKMKSDVIVLCTTSKPNNLTTALKRRALKLNIGLDSFELRLYMQSIADKYYVSKASAEFLLSKHLSPGELETIVVNHTKANKVTVDDYKAYFQTKPLSDVVEFVNAFCQPLHLYSRYMHSRTEMELNTLSKQAVEEIVNVISKVEFKSGKQYEDFSSELVYLLESFSSHELYRLLYYIQSLSRSQDILGDLYSLKFEYEQSKLNNGFGESLAEWREANKQMYATNLKPPVKEIVRTKESPLELSTQFANFGQSKFAKEE